jgi:hypothetical protein
MSPLEGACDGLRHDHSRIRAGHESRNTAPSFHASPDFGGDLDLVAQPALGERLADDLVGTAEAIGPCSVDQRHARSTASRLALSRPLIEVSAPRGRHGQRREPALPIVAPLCGLVSGTAQTTAAAVRTDRPASSAVVGVAEEHGRRARG